MDNKNIEIEYLCTNGKLKGKEIKEELYYNDLHRITIYKCNKNNKEVQKYINDLNYILAADGMSFKGVNCVIIYKSIKNLSKEELEQIEGRIITYKLTN